MERRLLFITAVYKSGFIKTTPSHFIPHTLPSTQNPVVSKFLGVPVLVNPDKMTSSLSRQLSALQADSRVDAAHGAATRQSLLVGEAGSSSLALTGAQLRLLAQQGLANLAQSIPVLKHFGRVVFPPSQDDQGLWDEMEVDVEGLDKAVLTLENFLVILSPHFMTRDAQFLLQFLMNQHQVNYMSVL